MRRSLLLAVCLASCILIPAVSAKAGKPVTCGSDDTTLTVNFVPTDVNNTPYTILSDGVPGGYKTVSSKNNKVNVGFQVGNCTFDLVIDLFQSTRRINVFLPSVTTTAWFANFDRVASVPVFDGSAQTALWCQGVQQNPDGSFKTYVQTADGKTIPFDNYAGCGYDINNVPRFARRNVGFNLDNNYNLRFQTSPFGGNTPLATGTSYINVYHPDAKHWTLEPEAPGISVYWSGSGSDAVYTQMPFQMTVSKP